MVYARDLLKDWKMAGSWGCGKVWGKSDRIRWNGRKGVSGYRN
jgi:hypothetical protein